MLKPINEYDEIVIACGVTDCRKNVDGLALIVKKDFNLDPFSNSIFLFCNRGRNRMKALIWDKTGFILCYKRLDSPGAKYQWPKEPKDVRKITAEQLRLLLDGFAIEGFKAAMGREFF